MITTRNGTNYSTEFSEALQSMSSFVNPVKYFRTKKILVHERYFFCDLHDCVCTLKQ